MLMPLTGTWPLSIGFEGWVVSIASTSASPHMGCTASGLCLRAAAVDHPGRAEAVGRHAEALGPEGLPERHLHRAALRQRVEDARGFGDVVDMEGDPEPLRRPVMPLRAVGGHQRLIRHLQTGMEDE